MKDTKDLFSNRSGDYRKFRPEYPIGFLDEIISLCHGRTQAWDCGTGNGQVAATLSRSFEFVKATDISVSQLENAFQAENIVYSVSRAEQTEFGPNSFDLITVAQAVHWFDFEAFFREVKRVGCQHGVLAIWGYGLLRIDPVIDQLIDGFYQRTVGDFWNEERKHIENAYSSIPFPFAELQLSSQYDIEKEFTPDSLAGYIGTWSAVKNFQKSRGYDPIPGLLKDLNANWGSGNSVKKAVFPIFTKIGKIHD